MKTESVVCFGETLWDILPGEKIAGGAPMNVAIRLAAWGHSVQLISRVGHDEDGDRLLELLQQQHVDISLIQKDLEYPSGKVLVTLNQSGNASYEIVQPSAWDAIEATDRNLKAVAASKAFVFGSLAARSEVSAATLLQLCEAASKRVFDVNLRKPFVDIVLIKSLIQISQIIKLNDEELIELMPLLGYSKIKNTENDLQTAMNWLRLFSGAETICVTRGAEGALLLHKQMNYVHPGYTVTVKDTIGSGDSFLATLLAGLLNNIPPDEILANACAVGALVATHKGANPSISEADIIAIKKA